MIKFFIHVLLLATFVCLCKPLNAQIQNNGCVAGDFGIDAGVYSGLIEFGSGISAGGSNDWFQGPSGIGVIDQTNPSSIQNLLQNQFNSTYLRRMSYPNSTILNNKILIDAIWARDHFGGTLVIDKTSYTSSAKNGQDPGIWPTGPANALGKNDLIDVGGHMFRTGTSYQNSNLWFVGFINRAEPGGTAYMDFEFYQEEVQYDSVSGFTSGGPDLGHTSYQFEPDPSNPGKYRINKIGDFIFNVSLINGGIEPVVEVRIWVSRNDYNNITPSTFSWGPEFDGAFNGSPYGYASIIPLTVDVCGIVNKENQLPAAPPWGTRNTKSNVWGTTYQDYSITEVGINLTDFGIDHVLLEGSDPCFFPINTFVIKTRASASFTAQLKDFAGPYSWGQPEIFTSITGPATLSCNNPVVQLVAMPNRSDVTYLWKTIGGNIISDPTQRIIQVDKTGTYYFEVVLPTGCVKTSAPTVVTLDNTKPLFVQPPQIQTTTSCNGNDGKLTIRVQGGTAPYTFTFTKNGLPYTVISNNLTGIVTLNALTPGIYQATVKGVYNCTVISAPITITDKTPININGAITNVDCFGNRTGAIDVQITGGKLPLTYQWTSGNITEDISNLRAGNYTINVTDGDGCLTTKLFTVEQPVRLSETLTKSDDTNPNILIGNGTITVTPVGGTPGYLYSWVGPNGFTANSATISNLITGNYQVLITDANGCTYSTSVFIYEPEICDDGIDNDGNGLIDCQDPACKPIVSTLITPSNALPCVGQQVTYNIQVSGLVDSYQWVVPSGANIISGQGTSQITVVWSNSNGGQICVRTIRLGCVSNQTCINVTVDNVPVKPSGIIISNN